MRGATEVFRASDGSLIVLGDNDYPMVLATAPTDPCEWDATIEASDPECVEPDPEPEPEPDPVGCDATAGMVDTDAGCAQLVRLEPEWTEVAVVFALGVLICLGALVVAQLARR